MAKQFSTIKEIIEDDVFIKLVETHIIEIKKKRNSRPSLEEGYHYKRDWYDRMNEVGHVCSEFFLLNMESVVEKRSSLSSEIRSIIRYVFELALSDTIEVYAVQSKADKK